MTIAQTKNSQELSKNKKQKVFEILKSSEKSSYSKLTQFLCVKKRIDLYKIDIINV